MAPDVSSAAPDAGMGQLAGVRPDKLAASLGGVSKSIGNTVTQAKARIAKAPAVKVGEREPPAETPAPNDAPPPDAPADAAEGADTPTPPAEPTPEPDAPPAAASAPAPSVTGGEDGKMTDADAQKLAQSVQSMSTADPALKTDAGPAPKLDLSGKADPENARQQRAQLEQAATAALSAGRTDIAQKMGEDNIFSDRPEEELALPESKLQTVEPQLAAAPEGDVAIAAGIIAQENQQADIDAAVARAQGDLAEKQKAQSDKESELFRENDARIQELKSSSAAEQAQQRAAAQAQVTQARAGWQAELDQKTGEARRQADAQVKAGMDQVASAEQSGQKEANAELRKGEKKAETERKKGEREAKKKKDEAKKESGGVLGWLASKAKSFFKKIKEGISKAIAAARKAVKAAIDAAKKLAVAAIERARKAIVSAIQAVGKAVMAIGDQLLAAFPEARKRFREKMQKAIDDATNAVNAAADKLKKDVTAALDALGKGLDAALQLAEKGLHAIVDGLNSVVQGAIKMAKGLIDALAAFGVLVRDVATNPGGWISNLGAAVMDGLKVHFWKAFKKAAKEWFYAKILEVLGIGGIVIKILAEGGIDLQKIGKTAWEGLKTAIPVALIAILVEKLVAMIVPAAGAVIAIIEGLQAAWGTVSRIIAAFEKFMAFLKAVKGGNAGPQFGEALAAAGVVVLDFVSNWLLKKLRKAARKIGNKFKKMAAKLKKKGKGKKGKGAKGKGGKKGKKETPAQKRRRLAAAVADVKQLSKSKVKLKPIIKVRLALIKRRHKLTALSAQRTGGKASAWKIHAKVNPEERFEITAETDDAAQIAKAIDGEVKSSKDLDERKIRNIANKHVGYWSVYQPQWSGDTLSIKSKEGDVAKVGKIVRGRTYKERGKSPAGNTLFVDESGREYVLDAAGQKVKRRVVRDVSQLDASNIGAGKGIDPGGRSRVTPHQHAMGAKPSPYSSTTKLDEGAVNPDGESFYDPKNGRYQIDLFHVNPKQIFDLSTKKGQETWGFSDPKGGAAQQALADVVRTQEVLVKGKIPQAALRRLD